MAASIKEEEAKDKTINKKNKILVQKLIKVKIVLHHVPQGASVAPVSLPPVACTNRLALML